MKFMSFTPILNALTLGFGCVIAQVPTSAQNATTTVGWWHEGVTPPVVAEQIGGSILELTVRRAGNVNSAFAVDWATTDTGTATPGSDFVASSGTLVFAVGEEEKVIQVSILDDGLLEYPETIVLRLFNASNGVAITNPIMTAVIADNEIPPTLDLSARNPFNPPPLTSNLTAIGRDGSILEFDRNQSGRLLRFAVDGRLVSFSRPINVQMNGIPEHALLATPDNKAILWGEFMEVNGIARRGIVRLLLDGTVDKSFTPSLDLTANFKVLAVQRDRRMLVATPRPDNGDDVIRLLEDGSRDTTFASVGLSGNVTTALELDSGALLVEVFVGRVFPPSDKPVVTWVRILPAGGVDASFQPVVRDCSIGDCNTIMLPDGNIVLSDVFPGDSTLRFRKMKQDGSLDENFHVPSWVRFVGPALPDGRLLATGLYAGGGSHAYVVILMPDGSIDATHPGFVIGGNGDACGQQIAALSESIGVVYGCVGSVNGRRTGDGTRVPLRGPFKNLIYSSSISIPIEDHNMRAVLEFVRAGETTGPASVRYRTRDGTAKAGQQYVAASGDVTFAPLENTKIVEIALLPRSEFTETFEVVLENAIGAEIAGAPITVSILGRQPRFGSNPIQFLVNGSALITELQADCCLPGGGNPNGVLESSEDLKTWTPATDIIKRVDYPFEFFLLDVSSCRPSTGFYRLRKL